MKRRLLSLLLVFVMVLGMLPMSAMATETNDTVYISVSFDGQYVNDKTGEPMAYIPVSLSELQAIDLEEYGLTEYDYNSQLTALHLYIYTHEKIMGNDWNDVSVSGGAGSIFFANGLFGFQDCNLQYYCNGEYPEVDGWGVTADQLVLNDGDFFDIAAYTSWAFYSDSAFGFHYFLDNEEIAHEYTATAGEPLTVTLGRGASYMGGEYSMTKVSGYTVSYGTAYGAATGTVTTNTAGQAEITFAEAGTYYLWVDGGYGAENPLDIVSAPGCAKVTVTGATEPEQPEEPISYTVTIATGEGYTIAANGESASPVAEGGSYSFTVTIADGYEAGENFAVKVNDVELTAVEGIYTIESIAADQTITVEGVAEKTSEANPVTVIAPIGSTVSVGTLKNYFVYTFAEPLEIQENETEETVTYGFPVPNFGGNSFVRVQHPEGVTYWDYEKMEEGTVIEVTAEELFIDDNEHNSDTIIHDLSEYEMDVADVYINANVQGYMPMQVGDTHEFNVFRDWHAVEGISNAKTALPDVSYQVIDIDGKSSDVVTIVPDENNSSVAAMTANEEGTAIVLVTYDAMYSTEALRGAIGTDSAEPAFFSAIWPENTGVLVVTVGSDGSAIETNMTLNGHALDAEHDVLYYVGNDGASYTFKPEGDCKVAVARARLTEDSLTYSGFESVDANADGSFTVTGLTAGSHIIEVERDGEKTYQVICAKQTTVSITDADGVEINDANPANPGEKVIVQLGDIYNPVNKLSGTYNSNCAIVFTGEDDRTFNGNRGSGFGYYLFASDPAVHKIELTIPEVWAQDTYTLASGYFSLGGNGKSAGAHRALRYATGAEMDSNAPSTAALLGSLPQVTIPVNASDRVAAEGIVLNKTTLSLNLDGADQLTATVTPEDTTDRITWISSDASVAAVSKNGVVTGISAGEAVITATAGDISASCTVTVAAQQAVNLVLTTQNAYDNEVYLSTMEFSEITLSGLTPTGEMEGIEVKDGKNVIADRNKECTIYIKSGNDASITVSLKPLLGMGGQNSVSKLTYVIGDTASNPLSTYADFVYTTSVTPVWNDGQADIEVKLILKNKTTKDSYTIHLVMEEPTEPTTYTVTLPAEPVGYTVAASGESTSPVTKGGNYSFTVAITDGYKAGETFAVKANDTKLTAVEGVYTIENITADQVVTVEGVEVIPTYTVTLPTETTGYTVTATENSASPVTKGGSYSFTVAITDGYEAGEDFAVKANDVALTAASGIYTIENITADQTVTVEGVVEKQEEPALTWQEVMAKTQAYLAAQAEETAPVVDTFKGEWMVLGLSRNGITADYMDAYYENVKAYVSANIDENGRLHAQKSTDNSRVILALTALGYDPANVEGYDLLKGLSDLNYVKNQGINGPVFALIALDSRDYPTAGNATATREAMVEYILSKQLEGGGWALAGQVPDDMTPMTIQALAPYYDSDPDVKAAVDKALTVMATMNATPETYAQMIVALSALGIDCESDERFDDVLDQMLSFALADGSFEKGAGTGSNQMTTEQAFYALVAYNRFKNDQTSLYDMTDVAAMKPVEILPCENGTITVDKNRAEAGETITVTVTPALGYKLKSLKLNDTELTVTDGTVTFIMPNGTAILEAVFEKSLTAAASVGAAMEALHVQDADRDTYQMLEELRTAYGALTAAEKLSIRTSYERFQTQVAAFEAYLDEVADDAADEIDDFLADLDEDDYTNKQWRELEALADEGKSAVYEGRYAEEIEDILDDYLDELEKLAEGEMEVTFRLIGDFQHDNGVSDHDTYVTWIPTTEYKLPAGSAVYDLFIEAIDDFDLNERGASRDYVESIQAPDVLGGYWLGEFDNGQNSGWMYTVNGDHPGRGLKNWKLEDGDEVIWHYVDDYIKEERTTSSKYYYRWLEADDIDPETYVRNMLDEILTVGKHGKADPDEIELRDIGKNITFTFTPDKGYKVKKVTVDGKSVGAIERYTYKDLQIDSRIEVEFVKSDTMNFIDVDTNDWYHDDVQFVVENELFEGTEEGVFSPESNMTRAMLVTVLYRLEGAPSVSGTSAFTDVQKGQYYADAVLWATRNGIVGGYGNGLFGTHDPITREQMAAILYRYAAYKGYGTARQSGLYTYNDRSAISAYALDAMEWANAEGLINGRTADLLVPQGTAIRAEVAAIFHRFVENIVK